MNINKIITINELIRKQRTGKPKLLASRIGVSERTVYHYISFLKTEEGKKRHLENDFFCLLKKRK